MHQHLRDGGSYVFETEKWFYAKAALTYTWSLSGLFIDLVFHDSE